MMFRYIIGFSIITTVLVFVYYSVEKFESVRQIAIKECVTKYERTKDECDKIFNIQGTKK